MLVGHDLFKWPCGTYRMSHTFAYPSKNASFCHIMNELPPLSIVLQYTSLYICTKKF